MAISYEIVLGFSKTDLDKIEQILGVDFKFNDYYEYSMSLDENMEILDTYIDGLNKAYIKTLKEVGFKPINEKEFIFETPVGVREFRPFRIETYYDPEDIGDKYEDIVIGISLSSRYKPILLDWTDKNGSLNTMILDEQMESMIKVAQRNISDVIPIFNEAKTIIKLRYY